MGYWGTYPKNNGDPQCACDDNEAPGDDTPTPEQEPPSQEEIDERNERNPDFLDARDNAFERGR